MSRLTRAQAERILAEVPFRKRLNATRMAMPSGMHPISLCSLEEVYWFLEPSLRTLPGIRLGDLADWIEDHFQDPETATEIRRVIRTSPSQVQACEDTWKLLGSRLREAREALYG